MGYFLAVAQPGVAVLLVIGGPHYPASVIGGGSSGDEGIASEVRATNYAVRKLKRPLEIGVPTTSICRRSRVPTPNCSASRNVLSQVSKGGVPRSAIGSNPMSAMPTASVLTQFVPAISRPGLTCCRSVAQGPSPPVIVWTP